MDNYIFRLFYFIKTRALMMMFDDDNFINDDDNDDYNLT